KGSFGVGRPALVAGVARGSSGMQQPEVASGNGARSQAHDAPAPTPGAPDDTHAARATADRDVQPLPPEAALDAIAAPGQGDAATETREGDPAASLDRDRALDEIWRHLQRELAQRVKREQFETWFRRARLRRAAREGVCLAVQNTFARDWLKKNYQA